MLMNDYQEKAASTAVYDERLSVIYPSLGLAGEAGESAEKVRNALFPDGPPKGWDPLTEGLKKVYYALDAAASAGRICEVEKKKLRDLPDGKDELFNELKRRADAIDDEQSNGLAKEIGDNLWYESALARDLGMKLSNIAQANLDKLAARKAKGTLSGSGDSR